MNQLFDDKSKNKHPLIGTSIDQYDIIDLIATGGMGVILKGQQRLVGRDVAIKLLPSYLTADHLNVQRLKREAKALAQLNHPNIVTTFDFGFTPNNEPYLVMAYVSGTDLGSILRRGVLLHQKRVVRIFLQVAAAVRFAHEKGIMHRDLKPPNVMISAEPVPDHATLLDFGIARIDGGELQKLTRTGEVVGSPVYMSPEQCTGGAVDERSDIYSFGVSMYETLTGLPTHRGTSVLDMVHNKLKENAPRVNGAIPDYRVHKLVDDIVYRCLQVDPSDRYSTMEDVFQQLKLAQQLLENADGDCTPDESPEFEQAREFARANRSRRAPMGGMERFPNCPPPGSVSGPSPTASPSHTDAHAKSGAPATLPSSSDDLGWSAPGAGPASMSWDEHPHVAHAHAPAPARGAATRNTDSDDAGSSVIDPGGIFGDSSGGWNVSGSSDSAPGLNDSKLCPESSDGWTIPTSSPAPDHASPSPVPPSPAVPPSADASPMMTAGERPSLQTPGTDAESHAQDYKHSSGTGESHAILRDRKVPEVPPAPLLSDPAGNRIGVSDSATSWSAPPPTPGAQHGAGASSPQRSSSEDSMGTRMPIPPTVLDGIDASADEVAPPARFPETRTENPPPPHGTRNNIGARGGSGRKLDASLSRSGSVPAMPELDPDCGTASGAGEDDQDRGNGFSRAPLSTYSAKEDGGSRFFAILGLTVVIVLIVMGSAAAMYFSSRGDSAKTPSGAEVRENIRAGQEAPGNSSLSSGAANSGASAAAVESTAASEAAKQAEEVARRKAEEEAKALEEKKAEEERQQALAAKREARKARQAAARKRRNTARTASNSDDDGQPRKRRAYSTWQSYYGRDDE